MEKNSIFTIAIPSNRVARIRMITLSGCTKSAINRFMLGHNSMQQLEGLSRMMGNCQVRFLGEGCRATCHLLPDPKARDRYNTVAEYHRIRDALLIGADGRPTSSGAMVQCYIDLCYLLYQ